MTRIIDPNKCFADTPVDMSYRFNCLFIPEDHKKVLRAEPPKQCIAARGKNYLIMYIDWEILRN